MTTRIIAGERRGALLRTPEGPETRPTLGRIRASLFMILMPRLEGACVLDAFAGSGALGLEALSRGAAHVTFLERSTPALEALRANIAKFQWQDRTRVLEGDALKHWLKPAPPAPAPFDLVLLDPPYGQGLCDRALEQIAARPNWLAPDAWVVAQADKHDALSERYGMLHRFRETLYSRTRVAFYRTAP